MLMMHHEVTFKKASVMSMALLSIFCISLQAMDELAYLRDYSDDVETADDDTLISSIRTSAQKVKEVPVSGEAQLALKNRGLPEMQEHANTSVVPKPMEEIVIVPPAQPVPATKQNSGWNWVSFTPLLENQAVLYGVGVVGILTISAVTYVLYKNGVFT